MKTIPTALQNHLDTRSTTLAWCWRVERSDGTVLGFTDHDVDLSFDSVTYKASTGMIGTEVEQTLGLSVDNMELEGAIDSVQINEADLAAGKYDGAEVTVYLVNWSDVSERVLIKSGNLGSITRGRVSFQAEFRGLTAQLGQSKGRLYQYSCDALLGDSRCGVTLAGSTYTGNATVVSTDGARSMVVSGLSSYSSGWFDRGVVTFTAGDNDTLKKEVKTHIVSGGIVTLRLWEPMYNAIEVGDTLSVTAGCDKTFKTCKAKFSNAVNFRGFPHIPGSNQIVQYANEGDPGQDGEGLYNGRD